MCWIFARSWKLNGSHSPPNVPTNRRIDETAATGNGVTPRGQSMIFATQEPDLLDWLIAVLQMKKDVVAQGLWIGLGLSTVYLMVMLLTRWGDRHTLFKALVFSGL